MRKLQPLRDAMKGRSLHPAYLRVLRELGEHLDGASPSWIAETLAGCGVHLSHHLAERPWAGCLSKA
jgi:hypothetical protein